MLTDIINLSTQSIPIELKSKNKLTVKENNRVSGNRIFFDIEHKNQPKNFLLHFMISAKMETGNQEIRFYYRYQDDKNYCIFTIRGGQYIKFAIIGNETSKIQTSWIKISNGNLFNDKFPFFLSVFEETSTVIIDDVVVLNIEHTPEIDGKLGIQFACPKGESFDLSLNDFNISTDILSFEPIIEFPKQPDVFFMQGNDFYEQNRYDLALFYYKKGLLYGKGDDKIYNRIGNLLFLIEEFDNAENYYRYAMKLSPGNVEYKINLGRALLKLNRDIESKGLLEEAIKTKTDDPELYIDYASLLMKSGKFKEALDYLAMAEKHSKDNFAVLSKSGKCLIELNQLDEGKKLLLEAAKIIKDDDPSSAAIVLKYSIDKKADIESLKILAKILETNHEYKDIYELLKKSQWDLEFDTDLLEIIINAEIHEGLYNQALDEFKKFNEKDIKPKIRYLKAKVFTFTDNLDDANTEIDHLLNNMQKSELSINDIVHLKLVVLGKSNKTEGYDRIFALAQKNKPHYDKVLEEYGKILVDLGKNEEALKAFAGIKEVDANNAELFYNMGLAYMGINEFLDAKNNLFKAFKIDKNPLITFSLINSLFFTGNFNEALDLVETYYNELPSDGTTDNLLGNILLALGNIVDAQKNYYKALEIDPDNEEFALNLAESFYKLKDYKNAFHITKQIVKKDSLDRAKSLHLRIKAHLYDTINCVNCYKEWNIPKDSPETEINPDVLQKLPPEAPAGFCPKCKTVYCHKCVKGIPDKTAKCLKCGTVLQYDSPGLKIVLDRIIRGEND
jgi:tetratricopeptide (TPR) repeat protein